MTTDATTAPAVAPPEGEVPPWLLDALLGTVVAAAIALIVAMEHGGRQPPDVLAYSFAAGFGALMLLRRRLPRTMLTATVLGTFAYHALGYPPIGVALPVVAGLFATADAGLTGWAVGAGAAVFGVSTGFRLHDGEALGYLLGYEGVSNIALITTAIALGYSTRGRRVRAAQQARIALLTADQAARDAELRVRVERERVSRDLHDTVGHAMSVISLQAGVAAEAIGHDDTEAREAVRRIQATSARSLRDVRSMVRLLRAGPDAADGHGVLSLSGVADLAETARGIGVDVRCDIRVRPDELAPQVDVAAYRIVQESLTNVVRHAGASRVRIEAGVEDGALLLTVADNGRGPAPGGAGDDGHGLAGMRERVRTLGGTLTAGRDGTGFTVRARLPARWPE
ncbi:sensor histidine kinase [Marinactinospora rubrisoli]|uniref:histidine kinase n=1 Tax=Marinactinospora rubrisoli TaxID=2715399 RepID=A0ABW2KGL3_9ACTN